MPIKMAILKTNGIAGMRYQLKAELIAEGDFNICQ